MMKEIMRIDDPGKQSFVESVLIAEQIHYLVAGVEVEGGLPTGIPARLLVQEDDCDRAIELLNSAGLKHEIYPMRKPDNLND